MVKPRGTPTFLEHLIASRAQTLEDVAIAHMATVAVISGDEGRDAAIEALRDDALARGFAVASCSLAEIGLHDLHEVVAALAHSLRVPGVDPGRRNGLVAALDAYVEEHGKRASERFEEAMQREALSGELAALAREYVATASGRAETRRIHAWLGGRDVTLTSDALRPLAARTAKRALAQLTRLVRALGHRGTRAMLVDAEALIDLSAGRRDVAYTVLRELIDNADGGHGMMGAEVLLIGARTLETRVHTLTEHPALASRIEASHVRAPAERDGSLPIPHQTWIRLDRPGDDLPAVPEPRAIDPRRAPALRALVRSPRACRRSRPRPSSPWAWSRSTRASSSSSRPRRTTARCSRCSRASTARARPITCSTSRRARSRISARCCGSRSSASTRISGTRSATCAA